MSEYRRTEMVSCGALFVTCKTLQSTVLITHESTELHDFEDDFYDGKFHEKVSDLKLISPGDRDVSNRVAMTLNLSPASIEPVSAFNEHESWWVIRLSESVIVAKPVVEDEVLGAIGAEALQEFRNFKLKYEEKMRQQASLKKRQKQ